MINFKFRDVVSLWISQMKIEGLVVSGQDINFVLLAGVQNQSDGRKSCQLLQLRPWFYANMPILLYLINYVLKVVHTLTVN